MNSYDREADEPAAEERAESRTVTFTGPRTVEVEHGSVPEPGPEEVLVEAAVSAISAGTEGLLYRDEAPTELPADESIDALSGDLSYPLAYGYAVVGRVRAVGADVSGSWLDRRVFAYNPHESHFTARPADLVRVPDGVGTETAALLANVESAVTFLLDGEPLLGERAVVLGQGVVGLLTTGLLARTPLESLVTVDRHESRRSLSERLGADRSIPPLDDDAAAALTSVGADRADLTYELTGSPDALDDAIAMTTYDGRVIVGSWYGRNSVSLDLGGRFHRERIDVRSSQVSTIAPRHRGRFDRDRRHEIAWRWLERLELDPLITHRVPVDRAGEAYRLLDERPTEALQVLLTYDDAR
ncbi:zinc-dependent alcohol dehydrogenase [Natrarchaeobius oligotrophus]|uniref:Oxidoreductase n=1 Tax=Natrarchaeobius chitinivorans TaxID=1679083 RepID=A0A3N6MZR0_NATCH|nr:zinc-binding alcohol dehydrogenase [Natrarchaeobius chitinivorans]RQH02022.1 oxidoreductase [Natrarchaeobius chitinivorans]